MDRNRLEFIGPHLEANRVSDDAYHALIDIARQNNNKFAFVGPLPSGKDASLSMHETLPIDDEFDLKLSYYITLSKLPPDVRPKFQRLNKEEQLPHVTYIEIDLIDLAKKEFISPFVKLEQEHRSEWGASPAIKITDSSGQPLPPDKIIQLANDIERLILTPHS